jgi:hypothetical protein
MLKADVSEHCVGSIFKGKSIDIHHRPAFEDGTDTVFRNVGFWHSDAGDTPKRKLIAFNTWRKLKIKITVIFHPMWKLWHGENYTEQASYEKNMVI